MTKNQSSNPAGRGGTLGMYRDSRVISKVQPPKIRIIHLCPPKIHHADVDDFRDLVQRLTGKNGGKVKGKGKGKKVKQEAAMIRCDNPTVIIPKVEAGMMGTPGSSSSSDHGHHDHNNSDILYAGNYLPTCEVDDGFDFNSLFNLEGDDVSFDHDHHLNLFGETTKFY